MNDHFSASIDKQYFVIFISASFISSYFFFSSTTCSFVHSSSALTAQFDWRFYSFRSLKKFCLIFRMFSLCVIFQNKSSSLHTITPTQSVMWKKNSVDLFCDVHSQSSESHFISSFSCDIEATKAGSLQLSLVFSIKHQTELWWITNDDVYFSVLVKLFNSIMSVLPYPTTKSPVAGLRSVHQSWMETHFSVSGVRNKMVLSLSAVQWLIITLVPL